MITRKHKVYRVGTVSYPADYWGKEIVPFFETLSRIENFYLTKKELKKLVTFYDKKTKIRTVSMFLTIYCAITGYEVISVSRNLLGSNEKSYTITFSRYE